VGNLTHGLNYGTAVFGGIRGYWNDDEGELFVFRPEDHYRRFLQSSGLLRMELPYTAESLAGATMDLLRAEGLKTDCYIRPLAFYGDEIIGVRLHNLSPRVAIAAVPFGLYVENDENAHCTVSSWRRVDDNMIPARGKIAGAYVNSALAKSDALLAGFDEAIVLSENGHVSEGSAENIFIVRNGVAITPPISENILEGITRRTIMMLLRDEMKIEVVERPIDRTELYLSDEVFFCGTGVQIIAVTRIDHRRIATGSMGPVVRQLRELYFNIVRGRVVRYRSWCMPVYHQFAKSAAPAPSMAGATKK
ncbi:MAG TPA: branched-chain amino acid transaminase, partial [Bacteroidota bacterium]|nr:branched-chain amino acid transaminase [Bacteroidota bacterium]